MRDGIYHAVFEEGTDLGQAVLVLRDGRVGGVGHDDGEYDGGYAVDAARGLVALDLIVKVPARTQITTGVTGMKAGPAGSTVSITGQGPSPDPDGRFTVKIAGLPVVLTLRFLRAMPG